MANLNGRAAAVPARMRALIQLSYDGPKALRMTCSVPVPLPGPGELLIRVAAGGVNFADVSQSRGQYAGGPVPPYVAGFEAAGEVVAAGPGVTPKAIGQTVVGIGPGAFAEYVVVPATAAVEVPEGWTPPQALGFVLNWATALAAIKTIGRLTAGETVLVHAAAGGVGQAAVRLAKHYDATVVALCSPAKSDIVRALGADNVVNSRDPNWGASVNDITDRVDVVLESVAGSSFASSLAVARPVTGRVVVFGEAAGVAALTTHQLIFEHQVQVAGLHIGQLAQHAPAAFLRIVDELHQLVRSGVYSPASVTAHALGDGAHVLAALERRETAGKQALQP